jgi:hypothetical protein
VGQTHLVPDRDPTATTVSHFCCFGFEEKKKRKEKRKGKREDKRR